MFHIGHINFLKQCRALSDGGEVIVSLNSDEFIEKYKGKAPIMSYEERKAILEHCDLVDMVVKNVGDADSKLAIKIYNPDIIAIGDDWAKKNYYKQMDFTQEWLDDHGILLVYLPYFKGISTTEIKKRMK